MRRRCSRPAATRRAQLVAFDMAALAEATGSVLSAVLFGALAGSGALPFPRPAFEAAIRRGQVGVNSSLAAFGAGFEAARAGEAPLPRPPPSTATSRDAPPALARLAATRPSATFPARRGRSCVAGVERLDDYQDADYARDYLARLERFQDIERQHGDGSGRLLAETARQLALGMAYEDTIRVADLKIRASRFARVREEVQVADGQILEIAEFFHPRTQEIADTLPAGLGRWLMRTGWARGAARSPHPQGQGRQDHVGRRLPAALRCSSKLKPLRRRSLRFAAEQAALDGVARPGRRDRARPITRSPCRSRACAAW